MGLLLFFLKGKYSITFFTWCSLTLAAAASFRSKFKLTSESSVSSSLVFIVLSVTSGIIDMFIVQSSSSYNQETKLTNWEIIFNFKRNKFFQPLASLEIQVSPQSIEIFLTLHFRCAFFSNLTTKLKLKENFSVNQNKKKSLYFLIIGV